MVKLGQELTEEEGSFPDSPSFSLPFYNFLLLKIAKFSD